MTIEVAVIISVLSIGFTIYNTITNRSKSIKNDAQTEASQMTALMIKLETMNNYLIELKSDFRNVKEDIQDIRERMIIVERDTKSAHERIDKIKHEV